MIYEVHKVCDDVEEAGVEIGNLYEWLGNLTLKDVACGAKIDVVINIRNKYNE